MTDEKLISVGKIIGFHGVKGEVKVIPLTDDPDRYQELDRVFLTWQEGYEERVDYTVHIEKIFYHKGNVIVKFKEFMDRNEVEELINYFLCILRKERPELGEGEYYYDEIIGLEVYDLDEIYLGEVTEIKETGSNDVYIVKNQGKEILLPALKQVVREIDLESGIMKVELMEGLLD